TVRVEVKPRDQAAELSPFLGHSEPGAELERGLEPEFLVSVVPWPFLWRGQPLPEIVHERREPYPGIFRKAGRHLERELDVNSRIDLRMMLHALRDTVQPIELRRVLP